MKQVFWFFLIVLAFGGIVWYELDHFSGNLDSSVIQLPPTAHITLDGVHLDVYVADTPAKQELGLGKRDYLPVNEGMLFVFPKDGQYAFWMKDMRFAIDMLWVADDGHIVTIAPDVSPQTYPKTFNSTGPARYVLEVNAGFVDAHQTQVGDFVYFQ